MVTTLRLLLFVRILWLTNTSKNGPVGGPKNLMLRIRMKNSLLGNHVVIKTINMAILPRATTLKNTTVLKYDKCFY